MDSLTYLIFCLLIINLLFVNSYKYISGKYQLFDKPDEKRKKQLKSVPLVGGLLFLINFLIFFLYEFFFNSNDFFYTMGFTSQSKIIIFCSVLFLVFFIGFMDDKIKLNPFTKLVCLSFTAYIVFLINPKIQINELNFSFYEVPVDLFNIGILFSVVCIVAYTNMLNMLDGINLISGIYYLSIVITLFLYNYQIPFALTLLISLFFFIFLNYKGKIYLGDNGVYLVSFLISLIIIGLYENNNLNVENIFILMFLPAIDFFRLIISRIHNNKHPFNADENHFHHMVAKKYNHTKKIFILLFFMFFPILVDFLTDINEMIIILFMIILYYFFLKKLT